MRASAGAIAFALLVAAVSTAQTVSEYRSNGLAMRLGELRESGDKGFVLRVTRSPAGEESMLLQDGAEVRLTRVATVPDGSSTETVWEKGEVTSSRSYDSRKRLRQEKTAAETRSYTYRGDLLEALDVTTADGTSVFRERYRYTPQGRLREAERTFPDGSRSLSRYLFVDGRLQSDRLQSGERVLTAAYDAAGRLTRESERRGETLEWERSRRYDPASGRLVSTSERHGGTTIEVVYDEAGRVVEETRTGSEPYRALLAYDGEGRKVRQRRVSAAGAEEWQTEYDAEGHARESYLVRGRLQRVRQFTAEREWVDTLYRDGKPVLRVSWRGDEKVGEERLP